VGYPFGIRQATNFSGKVVLSFAPLPKQIITKKNIDKIQHSNNSALDKNDRNGSISNHTDNNDFGPTNGRSIITYALIFFLCFAAGIIFFYFLYSLEWNYWRNSYTRVPDETSSNSAIVSKTVELTSNLDRNFQA
jgi:hypothetical protein